MSGEATPLRRTRGRQHGPIVRLVSPGEAGRRLKPFVFLDAARIPGNSSGFGWHPHSGIATVSVFFEGASWTEESDQVRHRVPAGGVEWVQAGGGVWHRGGAEPGEGVAGFQLWLALDEDRELEPSASAFFPPEQVPSRGPVRVALGEYEGLQSPVPSPAGITYLQVELAEGERVVLPRPPGTVAFLATLKGRVEVQLGSTLAGQLDGVELVELGPVEGDVVVEASRPTQLVFGHARPHPHPLVLGQHSVHTSAAALRAGEEGIQRLHRGLQDRVGIRPGSDR